MSLLNSDENVNRFLFVPSYQSSILNQYHSNPNNAEKAQQTEDDNELFQLTDICISAIMVSNIIKAAKAGSSDLVTSLSQKLLTEGNLSLPQLEDHLRIAYNELEAGPFLQILELLLPRFGAARSQAIQYNVALLRSLLRLQAGLEPKRVICYQWLIAAQPLPK